VVRLKYGKTMEEREWVKVHVATGIKTNVITAVEILDKNAGDSPQLPGLLNKTAETFKVEAVSADAAYLSQENMEAIAALGATPFIMFKENSTGGIGGLFAKMFHFYSFHKDEFLDGYHKRSNVESTFSMVKGKFGDSLRSKTDVAMTNEALCKILCHNICCLISSAFELGIEAKFWDQAELEAGEETEAEGPDEEIEALAWV
jgi:transposase